MSHFTEIKTQIKDIEALRLACRELGLTLLQNAVARGYYGNETKGDYVVQLKGPYDIALNKQADGTFGITSDLWNGHVEKEVGKGYGTLIVLLRQRCVPDCGHRSSLAARLWQRR